MKKVDAGGTTYYPGEYYEVKGGVVTKYYYLGGQRACPERSRRVAMKVGSTVYWLHGDHLGSASLTTNPSGGIHAQQRYFPYGQVRLALSLPKGGAAAPCPPTLPSQAKDPKMGLA